MLDRDWSFHKPRRRMRLAQVRILAHMERRGITRYELAKRMQLKRPTSIYTICKRAANPTMLRRMAAALRLKLTDDELYTFDR